MSKIGKAGPAKTAPSIFKTDASKAVYVRLLDALTGAVSFEVEVKKTSVHLAHGRAFAGVHPRATGIIVQIVTDAPIPGSRISKVEQVSTHRFHCAVKLEKPADVDAQLLAWLKKAHALTERA